MPLVISDETLKAANLTEAEARVEIACRLFDAGKLHLWPAAQLAGMSRVEFEDALMKRGIAPYRMDEEYVRHEIEYAKRFARRPEPDDKRSDR
jgi:predicted HTH domain antitoxin